MPDCLDLIPDEELLLKKLKASYNYRPSISEQRIRHSFWLEYEEAQRDERLMNDMHIWCFVVASRDLFKRMFLAPNRGPQAVYLVCRPAGYHTQVSEMLEAGLYKMRKILELPDVDSKGRVNMKLLELKMKITVMMDMRKHGAPTQNIKQLNMHVNRNLAGAKDVNELVKKGDMESIQKRLSALDIEKRNVEGRSRELPIVEAELVQVKK